MLQVILLKINFSLELINLVYYIFYQKNNSNQR